MKLIRYSLLTAFFVFVLNTISANALASNYTGPVDQLFWITVAGSVGVGGLVFGLMIYYIYKYRESVPGQRNPVTNEAKYEKIWLVFAIALVVILVLISTPLLYQIEAPSNPPPAKMINITASRYNWKVNIPYQNLTTNFPTTLGQPTPQSYNITLTTHTEYELNITSSDVDHSFFAYNLAIKVDAIPGQQNYRYFQIMDPGTYIVTCAEYCGIYHYTMQFFIIAKP